MRLRRFDRYCVNFDPPRTSEQLAALSLLRTVATLCPGSAAWELACKRTCRGTCAWTSHSPQDVRTRNGGRGGGAWGPEKKGRGDHPERAAFVPRGNGWKN